MNFFAHAVLAAARREEPEYVLGSMLPDLVGMAGLRLNRIVGDEILAAGVEFHPTTDHAFHGAPIFVDLESSSRDDLEAVGVDMGPAMAIGHVGVELLIDGWLSEVRGVILLYREALKIASAQVAKLSFHDPQPGQRARWQRMCARLVEAPVPEGYRDPEFVADRLVMILSRRPRLAIPPRQRGLVVEWARRAKPIIARRSPSLLDEVEGRLPASEARMRAR